MKRQYFFIPGLTAEDAMITDATQRAIDGDECFMHYHGNGQTCNQRCRTVEAPVEDEGAIF